MEATRVSIHIDFEQIKQAVRQLSPTEKLELDEIIWEHEAEIPAETQKLVLDRIAYAKRHPETMLDWDKVSKRFCPK